MDAALTCIEMPSTAEPSKIKIKTETETKCNPADARAYHQQVIESGGFDVDDGGKKYSSSPFINIRSEKLKEGTKLYTNITCFSMLALDHYNSDNNTNYRYVRFVKALRRLVAGQDYYITFEAKDEASRFPTIFQACVYFIPFENDRIDIILCRRKVDAKPEDNKKLLPEYL